MDHYLGAALFEDPDLGKTAYAYIKTQVGVNMYSGELSTLEGIRHTMDMNAGELQKIERGEANDWVRSQQGEFVDSLLEYKRAQSDLVLLEAIEGLESVASSSFEDMSGIFQSDGLAELNIQRTGPQVFVILRQKRSDEKVIRRIVDLDNLRGMQEYFEEKSKGYWGRQDGAYFSEEDDKKAATLLKEVLNQAETRQALINQVLPKNSDGLGMSPG